MPDYKLSRFRGRWHITWWRDGIRHRHSTGATDKGEAERAAPALYAELTRPKGTSIGKLWGAYCHDKAGRAVVSTMRHTWKSLRDRFDRLPADGVTIADCRAHVEDRRARGIQDGTIHTELGHLRTVLRWAEKHGFIGRAPHIERPTKPKPKERHLTRDEARRLIEAAAFPHVRLYIILALGTGSRNGALLGLTWSRCDFDSARIDLRDPELSRPHKGRAIVPMNRMLRAALQEAQFGAISPYVIEWAGKKVQSVKRGLARAAERAGLADVSPHVLRHTAAVHMAEANIPMEEIAQFLGHSNPSITRHVYARYSPDYLRGAASALEYDLGSLNLGRSKKLVGAERFERPTPTMSTKRSSRK